MHHEIIDHIRELGITAIELLPVHAFVDDSYLIEKGNTELLGLQHHRVLRAPASLSFVAVRQRIQGNGKPVSSGRDRGHS